MQHRPAEYLPADEDMLGALRRRGCLSLRALCEEFWPHLRWRPLFLGEDSAAEGHVAAAAGMTRAEWVWQGLGRLMSQGRIRVAGYDPDEVDSLAAAAFELLGAPRKPIPSA